MWCSRQGVVGGGRVEGRGGPCEGGPDPGRSGSNRAEGCGSNPAIKDGGGLEGWVEGTVERSGSVSRWAPWDRCFLVRVLLGTRGGPSRDRDRDL